ncbi:hypothetical protein GCM10010278_66080 [Streptomyces melanogenes]|nr:hypothetical protein GCM10010278_66080 [Streptomyces melanogenes]
MPTAAYRLFMKPTLGKCMHLGACNVITSRQGVDGGGPADSGLRAFPEHSPTGETCQLAKVWHRATVALGIVALWL